MRRGEVWNVTVPMADRVRPVLVLTNDYANEDQDDHPHACDVVPTWRQGPYAVQFADRDPLAGQWARIDTLTHYRRSRFIGNLRRRPLALALGRNSDFPRSGSQ